MQEFQQLRDSAVLSFDQSGVSVLQRLNKQYESVAPRLNGYQIELKASFKWIDAFKASKSIITTCFYTDWACFVYNLAALECQAGIRVDRETDEGIKLANKHFQQSAGYFDYILTNILPKCKVSTTTTNTNNTSNSTSLIGLTPQGLEMLKTIMLAQAQLCFYEKVKRSLTISILLNNDNNIIYIYIYLYIYIGGKRKESRQNECLTSR